MATTARALRLVSSSRQSIARRRLLSASSTASTTEAGGAGDAALHSGDAPSEEYTERPPRFSGASDKGDGHIKPPSEPTTKERVPPFGPSGKLGSQELADPASGASFTQKRRSSGTTAAATGRDARDEATPGREESAARKVREEDREYYRTHKPSPLAEVEFADTRKPVTRATDGSASDRFADVAGTTVEDTADDSLARAEAMFREAASRGNPEWPHSRALARMLAARRKEAGTNDAPWSS